VESLAGTYNTFWKEATAPYLNISTFGSTSKILPSSRGRTAGRMATKRKYSSVEVANDHNHQGCNLPKSKGRRLTAVTWNMISSVPKSHDVISYDSVNKVVSSNATGL